MKKTHRQRPSLLAPACGLIIGMVAASSAALAQSSPVPALPQSDPYALLPQSGQSSPAVAAGLSSPLMLSAATPAATADSENDWRFRLSFPIWGVGLDGDMTVKGRELSGSEGSDSFFDNLDAAGVLHFEAEKGQWGFFVDGMYVSLSHDKDLSTGGTAKATVEGFIGELGAFYTLVPPAPGAKGWGMFRADVLGGVRVSWLKLGAETSRFDVDREVTIVDPIVGARMELGLFDWLSYKLRGDIGGFDIDQGTTSNFAWNVDTGFEFHLAKWFDVDLGYRWLHYDFEKNDAELDLLLSGPYVTLQFRF